MTLEFINNLLERENESPVILSDCVLNTTDDRCIIYLIYGETDFTERNLEICYADNHEDIYKGVVKNEVELENIILKYLYD